MKKFYTLFLLLTISALTSAQTYNWEWQNPKPHGNDVNDIKYLGSDKVIAVAGAGLVQKSVDGGANWEVIKADTVSRDILSVCFQDANNGVLCGGGGLLMQTKDAGKTWSYLDSKVQEDLYDVKFMDSDTGYVVGGKGTVLKTKDGGKTWTSVITGSGTNYKVFILNAKNVFIASGTTGLKLMKSNDYGTTWTNTAPAGLTNNVYSVTFTDSVTGFIGTSNNDIYKTVDGGATWTKQGGAATSININDILFTDKAQGFATDVKGNIFATADSGKTWTSTKIPLQKFNAIDGDTSVIFIAGTAGTILKSADKGKTWNPQYTAATQQYLRQVTFIDKNTGYVCGGSAVAADSLGFILKTTDGGKKWDVLSNQFKAQVYGFAMVTPDIWCAVGAGNGIFRSTDAGKNWTKIASPVTGVSTMVFYQVAFGGKDTGYAVGNTGKMIKTIDGGQTWTNLANNAGTNTIWDLTVFNAKTVIFSALAGKVSKTTDGGQTWEALVPNVAGGLFALKFKDDSTGYVAGGSKAISRTTDGGKTWTAVTLPASLAGTTAIWGIAFGKDADWIVTGNGDILFSEDSAKTWQFAEGMTTSTLTDIVTLGNDLWVVGNNGIILHANEQPSAVGTEKSQVVKDFALSQNFPNPFNPSTVIRYSIPSEGMVSLKVFNVLGKEVASLVNEYQAQGTYSVKFDASRLSSGIYFYELRMGSQISTKKMLLIK